MIRTFIGIFSRYAHTFEGKAQKFFQWVNTSRSTKEIHSRLKVLMQENLLVLNVWLEKKFKNYRFMTKRKRRTMYEAASIIEHEFDRFQRRFSITESELRGELHGIGLTIADKYIERLKYIRALMAYFDPHIRFFYREQSTFAKLLVNPKNERMTGDCNQIVTMYAHLYARRYDIDDLQIKLLPGHVCLHFHGVDIEATSAHFRKYDDFDFVAPITELISTNILDIADDDEECAGISPETFVKSAQLAAAISGKREIVERNLEIAYNNLGVHAMRSNDFEKAVFYFERCRNKKNIHAAYRNAVVYFLKKKNFQKAHYYADCANDRELKKACYSHEYYANAQKVKGVKTIAEARKFRVTYQTLLALARKMGDGAREKQIGDLLKKL